MTKPVTYPVGGYDRVAWRWDVFAYSGFNSGDSVCGDALCKAVLEKPLRLVAKRITKLIYHDYNNFSLTVAEQIKAAFRESNDQTPL